MRYFLIVGAVVLLIVILIKLQNMFASPIPPVVSGEERYVPLGDSYTIGTSVDSKDNFPTQLTRDLNAHGLKVRLVTNPAQNGWTSQQLIDNELLIWDRSAPALTTLLIGVNDFNQGVPIETFHANLKNILDHVKKTKVILITIPDFSVTPTGKTYGDPKSNSTGIQKFNKVIKEEGKVRNLPVVDIFDLSQDMSNDSSLRASDDLHPSNKEYTLWEKLIFPYARLFLVPATN